MTGHLSGVLGRPQHEWGGGGCEIILHMVTTGRQIWGEKTQTHHQGPTGRKIER